MTTQYTSILKLALPVQGELSGTWGDVVNDNITSMVEEAVAGRAVINTWTTNSHTLTTADGTTSESRCAMLEFTDTGTALTGAATVVCPSASKLYVCKNDSGQQVTVKTAAGTGVAIPDGQTMFVFCDGTNVEQCETNFNSLSFNGYTLNFGGAVTTAGAFTTSGAYALTLTTTGATNVTLPTTGTLATLDGTETLTNKTLTAPTITSPTLTGTISATDLDISGNTTIGDDASDTLTVDATITSNLLFTDATYDIGATGATRPRDLFLSRDAVLGGTITTTGNASLGGDANVVGSFSVNTDKFQVAAATGNTLVAGTLGVTGATTATGGLNVDTINEITAAGGVTIDSVLLKDDVVNATDIEVSSISANDGTEAATIADSTGVMTIASSVLTTTDINGGSIDGTVIGGTTPAAISGTTLEASTSVTTPLLNFRTSANSITADQDTATYLAFEVGNVSAAILRRISSTSARLELEQYSTGGTAATYPAFSNIGNNNTGVYFPAVDTVGLSAGAVRALEASTTSVVINEGGADTDFRVESDTNTHALFLNGANGRFGLGESNPESYLHVSGSGSEGWLYLNNTSPTADHVMYFRRQNSNVAYLGLLSTDQYWLNGSAASKVVLQQKAATELVINESSVDADFRVESNNNTHMLFVNAGTDNVGINTSSPGALLDVSGGDARVINTGGGVVAKSRVSTNNQTDAIVSARTTDSNGTRTGFMANAYPDASYASTVSRGDTDFSAAGWQYYTLNSTYENQTSAILKFENVAGTEYELINASFGEVIINQGGRSDIDFRVESDSNANMLFVDAGANIVNVGTNNSGYSGTFNVASGTNTQVAAFESSLGGAGAAATIRLGVSTRSSQGLILGSNGSSATVNGGSLAAYVQNTENANLYLGTNGTNNVEVDTSGRLAAKGIGFGLQSITEPSSLIAGKVSSGTPINFDCVLDSSVSDWSPAYMLILVNTTNSNQANILAAWWLYNMTHYNGSLAGVTLRDSGGNTGNFTVTISDQGGTDPITVRASITNPTNRINARIEVGNYYGVVSVT